MLYHEEQDTLFIVMTLIDLFKEISESSDMSATVKFSDISTYICDVNNLKINYTV